MQEDAGRADTRIRPGEPVIAPHPADHDQMHEQHEHKAQAQRAGRPGKGAADGVDGVEENERAAPDAEARQQPPEAPGRNGTRAHGRAPSIATSSGQRQHEAERDDARHDGVVEPEPRQAQVRRAPRRDAAGAEAQEIAERETAGRCRRARRRRRAARRRSRRAHGRAEAGVTPSIRPTPAAMAARSASRARPIQPRADAAGGERS